MKDQGTADNLSRCFSVENAKNEDDFEKPRSEKFAFAAKFATTEKVCKATFQSSPSQKLSIETSEAVSIAPQRLDSKARPAAEEVLKLANKMEDKDAYLQIAYAELHRIKRKWFKTYTVVQDSIDHWITIGCRLGKTKFDCLHQVVEMKRGDPESMCAIHPEIFMVTHKQ